MRIVTAYKSKDVEIFGSGFRKVFALCDKYHIRVESIIENGGFSFAFYRDANVKNVTDDVTINDTEPNSERKIATAMSVYALLKEDPTQTRESLSKKTGRTVRTIQRALDKLSGEGKIKRIGSTKKGYWEVY